MAVRKRGRRSGRAASQRNEMKMPNISSEIPKKAGDKSVKKNQKTLILAQEIKIARLLADNDKKVRDKVLKRLNKWLTLRSQSSFVFTRADFMCLWKGLFYCMWMSDKMLIQEELAESISKLVHCLKSKDAIVLYTSCALETLSLEWFGLDHYRIDKFAMLARRILRQTFVVCKNQSWNVEWVADISQIFTQLFLHEKANIGFNLHITEIYLVELAKVSDGDIPEDVVHNFVKPFVEYLITTHDEREIKQIMRYVFRYLIFQSDIGFDYMEKFNAWKEAGFPCARIDDMQQVEISDTEPDNEDKQFSKTETQSKNEKPLDPRAGRVDVELPQIPFNPTKIVELLSTYKFHPSSISKSRRQLLRLLDEYTELSQGRMPLGVKRIRRIISHKAEMDSRKGALRLIQFQKNLLSDKMNKKRKRENKKTFCDQLSINNANNEDAPVSNTVDSESKPTEITATTKADLQDTDANTVPLKKQKKNDSECDISSTKSEIIETKKKLRIETSKKHKTKKNKLNKKGNNSIVDKNRKCKTKKAEVRDIETSDDIGQYTPVLPISSEKIPLKEINNKSENVEKTSNKHQKMSLKKELPCQMKEQTYLHNSLMEKKKVIFGLSKNTAQHTSEYLQQVRKSPGIPFDAKKKPLASVLKMSAIPSPLNPFYKKTKKK